MPSSEYRNAVGGGLKLKGVKDSGIEKKKKKKKTTQPQQTVAETPAQQSSAQEALAEEDETAQSDDRIAIDQDIRDSGKTEAQRRHEERRKKRLDERLKREGVKTHKERVEELNKYLSGLSEHHDMPKIGPG